MREHTPKGRIHIGTSGWHYSHWVGPFYPKNMTSREFLGHYAQHFRTVEINNTFYHLPSRESLTNWRQGTPKDFLFSCKANRFITHMKKLKDPEQSLPRFFQTIEFLKDKLGPILFQLPPRWQVNLERLETFLHALPNGYRFAFEFRDDSWFVPPTYKMLTTHNMAFCLYNLTGRWSPEKITADFVYLRLHGPAGPYQGQYDEKVLRTWAKKCMAWTHIGKDVYCYFDNDEKGYAVKDARIFKDMVQKQTT